MKPKTLLLDFDGVLRLWESRGTAAADRQFELPPGTIARMAFGTDAQRLAVLGVVSHADWCADVREALIAEFGPSATGAVDVWQADRGRLDKDLVSLLHSVHGTMTLALLSDSTDYLSAELDTLGLSVLFDHVFASHAEGVGKPSPALFRRVLNVLGDQPQDILYVDDAAMNVRAARALGIRAEVWSGADALQDLLITAGRT